MIRAGDILLTAKPAFGSRLIQWKLNGRVSHCIPVVDVQYGLNTHMLGRAKIEPVEPYLDGSYRVFRLRNPDMDISGFVRAAEFLAGRWYDWLSLWGLTANKNIQDKGKFNCGEAALYSCHGGGVWLNQGFDRISPPDFAIAASAGLFDIERIV